MYNTDVYQAVKAALKLKLPLLFIDLQKGQFLKPEKDLPVPLPAALIEIGDINWQEFSKKSQKGNGIINVALYLNNEQNTFDGAEAETESLEMLNQHNDIFKAVNGIEGDNFEYVERVKSAKPKYGVGYICFESEFKITVIDNY
ncbi:MAG: hypothetical protein NTZ33_13895 [Bacteroidetes bacterium]|nr:hypothetical protein [Bacteroidota bacterium]